MFITENCDSEHSLKIVKSETYMAILKSVKQFSRQINGFIFKHKIGILAGKSQL